MQGARTAILVAALIASACGDDNPPPIDPGADAAPDTAPDAAPDAGPIEPPPGDALAGTETFVALRRAVDDTTVEQRLRSLAAVGAPRAGTVGSRDDFYLAIRREALTERWFLSAFMKQYFPGAVIGGAAYPLGTRVVSFHVQNGKLFVFDVDGRGTTSSVFDPQRIVEAFPVVDDPVFARLPGYRNYVIVDPAAGLNHVDMVSDVFGEWYSTRFSIELSFLQAFQRIGDGATWEQVFTGTAAALPADDRDDGEDPDDGEDDIETNPFRTSGTVGISLRRYREGEHYVEVPESPYFLEGTTRLVPDTGRLETVSARWDIHPGMAPIEWLISPTLAALDDTPAFADVDLVGAVRRGVEQWNEAFGFPALSARIARPDEPFSRDDVNYLIFDPDPTNTTAFTTWRSNPGTGETRGSSIYFSASWLDRSGFLTSAAASSPRQPSRPPRRRMLRWAGLGSQPLCARTAPSSHEIAALTAGLRGTPAENFESFIADLISHEIGHTLGLRHNFKGSLVPPTSSVMDYARTVDSIASAGRPGAYDIAAIRYLYGLSTEPPSQPFCNDEQVGVDPDCQKYDRGADPLVVQWIPYYRSVRQWYLDGETDPRYLVSWVTGLIHYALRAEPARAATAVDALFDGVAVPVTAEQAADPDYAGGADRVMAWVLDRLAAAPDATTAARIDDQIERVLLDQDGIRSAATRRGLVDLLEKRQSLGAYAILLRARDGVAAEVAAAPAGSPDALLARDLLARIDAAITPYFD
jgi:hypothetical protein